MEIDMVEPSSEGLVKHFQGLADLELKYASELKALSEELRHPVLKALIGAIAGDSVKHSQMYKAIVELLTEIQPLLTADDVREIASKISNHIRTELIMIEETKRLLNLVTDPRVMIIVSAIHADEVTHHSVLSSIEKNIARKEVFTEEEFWTQVWKDVPWHGAPGG
ncbi:MAG: hypothetical protein QW154_03395 [Sulfolobales archaeon]